MIRISVYTFAICVALCLGGWEAYAAPHAVSPFVIDRTVEQRDTVSETIIIKNTGGAPLSLYAAVNNISVGHEGGIESFAPPSMSDRTSSLASWIEVSRQVIELPAGETHTLPLTIRVNPNAKPGVYHAFIGFASGRTRDEAEALIMQGGMPGTIINITIEDTSSEFLKLSRFLINRFVTKTDGNDITYVVENTGDTVVVPQGDILLYNHRGEEVAAVPINPEGVMIEPGETSSFTSSVPLAGLLGKYKALLSIEYGTMQKASIHDTVFFYVLPWKKLAIAFGIFVAFALLLALWVHHRYLKEDDEDDGAEYVPLALRDNASAAHPRDIDMKK